MGLMTPISAVCEFKIYQVILMIAHCQFQIYFDSVPFSEKTIGQTQGTRENLFNHVYEKFKQPITWQHAVCKYTTTGTRVSFRINSWFRKIIMARKQETRVGWGWKRRIKNKFGFFHHILRRISCGKTRHHLFVWQVWFCWLNPS